MEFGEGVTIGSGITMGGIGVNRRPMPTPLFDLSTAPPIITDGLILHLDAGNLSSYSGSGQTWIDLSSSGLNATISANMATNYVQATAPYGYPNKEQSHFDWGYEVPSRYAEIPYNATLRPSNITVEMFIYQTAWTSATQTYMYIPGQTFYGGVRMGISSMGTGTDYYQMFINDVGEFNTGLPFGGSAFSFGVAGGPQWLQFAGTYDGSTIRTYKNGVAGNPISYSTPINYTAGRSIWLNGDDGAGGGAGNPTTHAVRAKCAILRLYNRALTAAEIKNNYDANKYRYGLT
jgi:hypothetical protein